MALFSFRGLAVLPLALLAATCQPRRPADSLPASPDELLGTWLQSNEESSGDTLVYRPNTYKFPPSRGRTGFAVGPAGRFTQFDIAPTDGLDRREGTWTAPDPAHLQIHLADGKTPDYTLEIISLQKGVLKLKQP
ncbi:hypothetical protein [Hymenobacter nivis]|uniref:Lipocalin-like domain-containing protein n=1 Tax=Hymenobacter nivis TaxID=1850093 RepID=A0A502GY21_9BACT|nr:hypothetical protein [Hymenobacter nivis]TPG67307.1 hypothetical protein EAH73_06170 [Hymenobacter nivis]